LFISTTKLFVQSVVYTYPKVVKQTQFNFFFSSFCSDIENIEPKMYLERTNVLNSRTHYLNISLCKSFLIFLIVK